MDAIAVFLAEDILRSEGRAATTTALGDDSRSLGNNLPAASSESEGTCEDCVSRSEDQKWSEARGSPRPVELVCESQYMPISAATATSAASPPPLPPPPPPPAPPQAPASPPAAPLEQESLQGCTTSVVVFGPASETAAETAEISETTNVQSSSRKRKPAEQPAEQPAAYRCQLAAPAQQHLATTTAAVSSAVPQSGKANHACTRHSNSTRGSGMRERVKLAVALCIVKQASAAGVDPSQYWAAQRQKLMTAGSDESCNTVSDALERPELVAKIAWLRLEVRELKQREHITNAAAVAGAAAATMRTHARIPGKPQYAVRHRQQQVQSALMHLQALETSGVKVLPSTLAADQLFHLLLESGMKGIADGGSHWETVKPRLEFLLRLSPTTTSAAQSTIAAIANRLIAGICTQNEHAALTHSEESARLTASASIKLAQLGSLVPTAVLNSLAAVVLDAAQDLARQVGGDSRRKDGSYFYKIDWPRVDALCYIFDLLETLATASTSDHDTAVWTSALDESAQLSYAFCTELPLVASRIWMLAYSSNSANEAS